MLPILSMSRLSFIFACFFPYQNSIFSITLEYFNTKDFAWKRKKKKEKNIFFLLLLLSTVRKEVGDETLFTQWNVLFYCPKYPLLYIYASTCGINIVFIFILLPNINSHASTCDINIVLPTLLFFFVATTDFDLNGPHYLKTVVLRSMRLTTKTYVENEVYYVSRGPDRGSLMMSKILDHVKTRY